MGCLGVRPGIERRLPHRGLSPGDTDIAIRPEAICLSRNRAEQGLSGTVSKATYLGSHLEYSVDCPLGELFVIDHRVGELWPSGTAVSIALADRGVTLVTGR